VTCVERSTLCIASYAVVPERSFEVMQSVVDEAPIADTYYSDGFDTYAHLWYPGSYEAVLDKSQTFSVEGDNAQLRHYLARLGRESRCFSRCIHALRRALDLFVFCWNQRQKQRRKNPKYPAHVTDYATMLF
jgi:IS1 family transposase